MAGLMEKITVESEVQRKETAAGGHKGKGRPRTRSGRLHTLTKKVASARRVQGGALRIRRDSARVPPAPEGVRLEALPVEVFSPAYGAAPDAYGTDLNAFSSDPNA